jgi:hypothetical protein
MSIVWLDHPKTIIKYEYLGGSTKEAIDTLRRYFRVNLLNSFPLGVNIQIVFKNYCIDIKIHIDGRIDAGVIYSNVKEFIKNIKKFDDVCQYISDNFKGNINYMSNGAIIRNEILTQLFVRFAHNSFIIYYVSGSIIKFNSLDELKQMLQLGFYIDFFRKNADL